MQVNSVSSSTSFGNSIPQKVKMIEGFASLDDKTIRTVAYTEAKKDPKVKANKILSSALWSSIPAMAGFATMAALKGAGAPRSAKVLAGLGTFASWAGTFAVFDGVGALKNTINKHSQSAKNFDNNHTVLSFAGYVAASIGALVLAGKGLKAIASKAIKTFPRVAVKMRQGLRSVAGKINNSQFITNTMTKLAKLPQPVKTGMKAVARNAHWVTALTAMTTSMAGAAKFYRTYANNYNSLKRTQAQALEILADMNKVSEDAE